jgi:hypothetical protein
MHHIEQENKRTGLEMLFQKYEAVRQKNEELRKQINDIAEHKIEQIKKETELADRTIDYDNLQKERKLESLTNSFLNSDDLDSSCFAESMELIDSILNSDPDDISRKTVCDCERECVTVDVEVMDPPRETDR